MRYLFFYFFFVFSLSASAEDVDKVIDLLDVKGDWEIARQGILISVSSPLGLDEPYHSDELKRIHGSLVVDVGLLIDKYFSWNDIKKSYRASLLETLNSSEISEMVTFFESSAGQKFLNNQGRFQAAFEIYFSSNADSFANESKILLEEYEQRVEKALEN